MFGMRKAMMLLVGAGVAGVLIWLAAQITGKSAGEYWATMGLLAGAGLALAFLHMVGRAGGRLRPTMSPTAFVLGFLPVLVVGGFVVWYGQPSGGWLVGGIHSFAGDIGVRGLVSDLARYVSVIAFGVGLVLGLTFDSVPRREPAVAERPQTTAFAPGARTADGRRGGFRSRGASRRTAPSRTDAQAETADGSTTGPAHPLSRSGET